MELLHHHFEIICTSKEPKENWWNRNPNTVKLDFKNRQDKNQLCFKNQITNDQLDQMSFKSRQDKNNLTLRTKIAVTKNVLKVKFDCICLKKEKT